MGCLYTIKSCKNLTNTEKRISEYILDKKNDVIYSSIQDIALKINTSPAAIIRFSKKLGYSGFSDLKLNLAKDDSDTIPLFSEKIQSKDSLESIIEKSKTADLLVVEQTYKLLKLDTFKDAVKALKTANKIYLFGIGSSGLCCYDFTQKLSRIGYNVVCYSDFHMQLAATTYITKEDVALAISYSGNTKEVNIAMEYSKEKEAKTIAITQFIKSPLLKLSDLALYIPTQEKYLRLGAVSSRNSSLILTDLLYLGMITEDLDFYKENLISSRVLVNNLR